MRYRELDISRQAEQSRNYWKQKVEQCPPDMMAREFVQNGIESPRVSDPLIIRWEPCKYGDFMKLSVLNNGRGMSPQELERLADMAWSGSNKQQGLTGNKGIGARVAGLKNNKYGVVYVSCYGGSVYSIRLCYVPAIDAYAAQQFSDDSIVIDISDQFTKAQRGSDWVRVIFLGNSREADTTKEIGSRRRVGWLPGDITHRFFRIPKGVEIQIDVSLTHRYKEKGAPKTLPIKTFADWFENSTSYDSVFSLGASIHYAHYSSLEKDDQRTTVGCCSGVSAIGAISWRGELYDLMNLSDWGEQSKHFAIPYVGRSVCVVVELPDEAPVYASEYRDVLLWDGGDNPNKPVRLRQFQDSIISNRPQWLLKLIEEKSKSFKREESEQLKQFLAKVWADLHLTKLLKVVDNTGNLYGNITEQETWSVHEDHQTNQKRTKRERRVLDDSDGSVRGDIKKSSSPIPRCIFCWTDEQAKAANLRVPIQYYEKPNEIYFDMRNLIVQQAEKEVFIRIKRRDRNKVDDLIIRQSIRSRIEGSMQAIAIIVIGTADFNRLQDPKISALQAVTDESLSALFGLLKMPAVLDEIASSKSFVVAA
jgi:hypothetical protein